MKPLHLRHFCRLDREGDTLLKNAFQRLGLIMHAHDGILRVACTIADLAGAENIEAVHVAKAIQYRSLDPRSEVNPPDPVLEPETTPAITVVLLSTGRGQEFGL